ncbi:hypothetical protein, partial [Pseudomonas sp. AD21]|uniref:hypothetical protein n=1 Tax=Pseudomonas sp. AD21 TaxID=396378 RepID=UPI001C4710F9
TPIAKAIGVLFCPQESGLLSAQGAARGGTAVPTVARTAIGEKPSEVVTRFLVWCSSFLMD